MMRSQFYKALAIALWALIVSVTGRLEMRLRTDVGSTSRMTVPDGNNIELGVWTHLAATWDASDEAVRFYKNGEQIHIANKADAAVALGPDVLVGVGNRSASVPAPDVDRPIDGVLDDLAIWNRALSPGEIAELMVTGISADGVPPVAVRISLEGNSVKIEWTGSAKLQSALSVAGPWTDVNGASSPQTVAIDAEQRFFRVTQ